MLGAAPELGICNWQPACNLLLMLWALMPSAPNSCSQALEDFSSLRIIATSRGSTVWEGTPKAAAGRAPACSVVLKAVCAAQLGRRALQQLLLEQRVLGTVRHPNIIKGLRVPFNPRPLQPASLQGRLHGVFEF